jgi:hypothetical protein
MGTSDALDTSADDSGPLAISTGQIRARNLDKQGRRDTPVKGRERGAAWDWPNIGAGPDERICLRGNDPGRHVIKTQIPLGVEWQCDGVRDALRLDMSYR